jgi:hypothetical protein
MGLQRFPISDFRGGLNTKDGPFDLESNEAQDLMNVTLSRRGILSERTGKARFDTGGAPPAVVNHMRNWLPSGGTRRLFCSIDGDIYYLSTGGVLSARVFDGTAASTWCFEASQDGTSTSKLWCLNGVDAPQKIDTAGAATAWANSPPNGTMLRLWKNRICIAGVAATPYRLFFSDIGNPESPAATYGTNWVDIRTAEEDTDPITWLEVLGDYLIVFKKNSTWAVTDPTSFDNRRIGGVGCEDRFMSAAVKGRSYFFNRQGVWSTDGIREPRLESEKIENYITDNINYGQIGKVRLGSSRDRRLFIALPFASSPTNNRLLEFIPDLVAVEGASDPRSGAWMVHDLPVSSLCTFRPANTDTLTAGDSSAGKVHHLFQGPSDEGVAINAWWQSGWRAIIQHEQFERIRRVNVEMSGRLVIDVFSDFSSSSSFSQLLTTPEDTDVEWGGGVWDGGTWDPITSVQLKRVRPETRARYHSVRFSNSELDKTFTVYAAELAIRGGKEHT